MYENKEKGIKIAENDEEAFWEQEKQGVEDMIKKQEQSLKVNKLVLKAVKQKLREVKR